MDPEPVNFLTALDFYKYVIFFLQSRIYWSYLSGKLRNCQFCDVTKTPDACTVCPVGHFNGAANVFSAEGSSVISVVGDRWRRIGSSRNDRPPRIGCVHQRDEHSCVSGPS